MHYLYLYIPIQIHSPSHIKAYATLMCIHTHIDTLIPIHIFIFVPKYMHPRVKDLIVLH